MNDKIAELEETIAKLRTVIRSKEEENRALREEIRAFDLVKAEQQLTGFAHHYQGYCIVSLLDSMGLKPEEWEILENDMPFLPARLVEEINRHFQ